MHTTNPFATQQNSIKLFICYLFISSHYRFPNGGQTHQQQERIQAYNQLLFYEHFLRYQPSLWVYTPHAHDHRYELDSISGGWEYTKYKWTYWLNLTESVRCQRWTKRKKAGSEQINESTFCIIFALSHLCAAHIIVLDQQKCGQFSIAKFPLISMQCDLVRRTVWCQSISRK